MTKKVHRKSDAELLLARARNEDLLTRRIREAEEKMAQTIAGELYGNGPEQRAAELRASVTGEKSPPPRLTGLAYWAAADEAEENP